VSFRTVLVIILALVCGGSAAIGIHQLRNTDGPAAKNETVWVVVAAENVPRFTVLTPKMLKMREFPKSLVPPGALHKAEDACKRATYAALVKEELVLDAKLAPRGAGGGMAVMIPEGMRAYTIMTPTVASGVAGFILPGNKVDVLLTVSSGEADSTGGGSTSTLLQMVEVLAVHQRVEVPADNKVNPNEMGSVTLLVTPVQAAKLDLGQTKGRLHLTLRNPLDTVEAESNPVSWKDLRFTIKQEPKAVSPKSKGEVHYLDITNGEECKRYEFVSSAKTPPRPAAKLEKKTASPSEDTNGAP
jgi:pilus assembly protein CpaB